MRNRQPELGASLHRADQPRFLESRRLLTVILVGALVWSLLSVEWSDGVIHARGLSALGEIVAALFTPEISTDVLGKLLASMWRTLAYAVAGLSLALVIGFPLGIVASGVLMRPGARQRAVQGRVRAVLAFFRSAH